MSDLQATTGVEANRAELIALNQELLDSIVNLDYETYDRLCADDMSCMEPESNQNVVVGKEFHKYYFDVFGGSCNKGEVSVSGMNTKTHTNVTMVRPHVQWIGTAATGAVLSYVKLTQQTAPGKAPVTMQQSETRVWEKREDRGWVNIHFHKSPYRT